MTDFAKILCLSVLCATAVIVATLFAGEREEYRITIEKMYVDCQYKHNADACEGVRIYEDGRQ